MTHGVTLRGVVSASSTAIAGPIQYDICMRLMWTSYVRTYAL